MSFQIDLGKTKEILKNFGVFPSKTLGQNFLIEKRVFEKILKAAELNSEDTVLEIGSGIGNLTCLLAEKAKRVIGVEKDKRMLPILKERLKNFQNVEIIFADIRKISIKNLPLPNSYKVVGNIPYYLTSWLIRSLLESEKRPDLIVLMVQKEVGERICAKPPKMNLLALSVQFFAKPKIISFVSRNSFWPKPKVDSAIIKIKPKKFLPKEPENFFKILKAGFSHPRKTLLNNLTEFFLKNKIELKKKISEIGINPEQRPEKLSLKEWLILSENLKF